MDTSSTSQLAQDLRPGPFPPSLPLRRAVADLPLSQNMAWRSGPDCGPDTWFAFEQFADGDECEIPAWNGPQYAKELEAGMIV